MDLLLPLPPLDSEQHYPDSDEHILPFFLHSGGKDLLSVVPFISIRGEERERC